MLKLIYREYKLFIYKADIYKSKKEDEWEVLKNSKLLKG